MDNYEIVRIGDHALAHGDCLTVMADMDDHSVDLILADLPYGTTRNKWDSIIPFDALWDAYWRVLKPNGVVVLTAAQPLTSALVMSSPKEFRYSMVFEKSHPTGHLNANRMPLRKHEDILIFAKGKVCYNPQKTPKPKKNIRPATRGTTTDNYGTFDPKAERTERCDVSFPTSIIRFNTSSTGSDKGSHPTQKPVDLMAYLVRTFSNAGDVVLDNTMGSGTTGVACVREGRRFRGIEQERPYFDIAAERVSAAVSETN